MSRVIFSILLSLFVCLYSSAQKVITLDTAVVSSTNEYATNDDFETDISTYAEKKIREINTDTTIEFNDFELKIDSINKWKNTPNYKWIKTLENDLKESLEKEKKEYEKNERSSNQNTNDTRKVQTGASATQSFFDSQLLKVILWILAILFIGFIVYNLFLNKGAFTKNTKQSNIVTVADEVDENNMENDFESLKRKAYNAGDTKLGMRYLFLKMLQKLDVKQHIKFGADKTNIVYAKEMKPELRNDFSSLSLYFEYIWYGNFEITKEVFDKIELQYNQFLNRI